MSFIRMVMCTRESISMENHTEEQFISGRMERSIKANGTKAQKRDTVYGKALKVKVTLELGYKIKHTDTEFTLGLMVTNTKVSLVRILEMVTEQISLETVTYTSENMLSVYQKDKVNTNGTMVICTLVTSNKA